MPSFTVLPATENVPLMVDMIVEMIAWIKFRMPATMSCRAEMMDAIFFGLLLFLLLLLFYCSCKWWDWGIGIGIGIVKREKRRPMCGDRG